MMNPQGMMDAINDITKDVRANYHVTLGELIALLKGARADAPVRFSNGAYPRELDSYRGHYSDLSISCGEAPMTAGDLLQLCEQANGKTFQGYKGGDFLMDEGTPLWCAEYGSCGDAIVDVRTENDAVVLVTKAVN